ncbi:MAG: tetratricopeptide repeat protein [Alphaproteobacteria bacterium]|nr:tetratricopeptide repeat protein [Alphaproteobacteria bacterium]MDX5367745.1 tetratricopeptide repeat protein [Alphaproteobacteria bacterium]MDX5462628.1 tetratricopeptide repeat protein [Alphaproteobacteria bacterium]
MTVLALALSAPAHARQTDPRLDSLFGRLQVVETGPRVELLTREIWTVWTESGSPTLDLLMKRAQMAANAKKFETAVAILDTVVDIDPDYAEGWNRRATVHFLAGDYARSALDIEKVLDLEPRHFGALSGLGQIMERIGRPEAALDAYRRALMVNPHLSQVKARVEELAPDVEGRGI